MKMFNGIKLLFHFYIFISIIIYKTNQNEENEGNTNSGIDMINSASLLSTNIVSTNPHNSNDDINSGNNEFEIKTSQVISNSENDGSSEGNESSKTNQNEEYTNKFDTDMIYSTSLLSTNVVSTNPHNSNYNNNPENNEYEIKTSQVISDSGNDVVSEGNESGETNQNDGNIYKFDSDMIYSTSLFSTNVVPINSDNSNYDVTSENNDYEIKTSQVISDSENDFVTESYELSDNSDILYKCIDNCEECHKDGETVICDKCGESYSITYNHRQFCNKTDEIKENKKYYFENESYYYCEIHSSIPNCKNCSNKTSCIICKDGFTFINKDKSVCKNINELGNKYFHDEEDKTNYELCNKYFNNCDTCYEKNNCSTCMDNYGLKHDKTECIYIPEQKYYKNQTDNLYYLCNTNLKNCEICSSSRNCIKCMKGYAKINNDNSNCHSVNGLNLNEYYVDPYDNNNYLKCSSYIQNCVSCEYETGCKICKSGFVLLNDNSRKCYEKSKLDLKNYFTYDNISYYSCNDYRYKNDLKCFSIIPQQTIILTFLQVQIINFRLVCFMITHAALPKDFSLKLKIDMYSTKKIRNLQNSNEREVILTTTDESNGSANSIVSFTLQETYNNEEEEIKVKNIEFNNKDSVTKTVTTNNICSLVFDTSSDLLDTGIVKSKIKNKLIPDCSIIQQESIVNLNVDNIEGCEFNLRSDTPISFAEDNLSIELIEYDNNENIITAECYN